MKKLLIGVFLGLLMGMLLGVFIGYKHTVKCAPGILEFDVYEKFGRMVSEELKIVFEGSSYSACYDSGLITKWYGPVIQFETNITGKLFAEVDVDDMIDTVFRVENYKVIQEWEKVRPVANKVAKLIYENRFDGTEK